MHAGQAAATRGHKIFHQQHTLSRNIATLNARLLAVLLGLLTDENRWSRHCVTQRRAVWYAGCFNSTDHVKAHIFALQ